MAQNDRLLWHRLETKVAIDISYTETLRYDKLHQHEICIRNELEGELITNTRTHKNTYEHIE